MAINHLGHFALINLLAPALRRDGSRVVMFSSAGHFASDTRWAGLNFERAPYDRWLAYGQSKTANVLFALELAKRGAGDGVRVFSLHPGVIMTPLQRHVSREEQIALGWMREDRTAAPGLRLKSVAQGAATAAWAATASLLADAGNGAYLEDVDIARMADGFDMNVGGVQPWATDEGSAQRLWEITSDATGVRGF